MFQYQTALWKLQRVKLWQCLCLYLCHRVWIIKNEKASERKSTPPKTWNTEESSNWTEIHQNVQQCSCFTPVAQTTSRGKEGRRATRWWTVPRDGQTCRTLREEENPLLLNYCWILTEKIVKLDEPQLNVLHLTFNLVKLNVVYSQ